MKTITITSRKGGTGKTTTAANLAAYLQAKGSRVLVIDLDSQTNLTYITGAAVNDKTAADVLMRKCSAAEAVQNTGGADIIAGSPLLSQADMILTETGKEYRLREALEPVSGRYDYCIIDTPAQLGVLTVNALTAADVAVITVQADVLSIQGVGQLKEIIQSTRKYCNRDLKTAGLLITRYNSRTILSKTLRATMDDIAEALDAKAFKTAIRECNAIKEAQTKRTDIFRYDNRSNAAHDYAEFARELIERMEK